MFSMAAFHYAVLQNAAQYRGGQDSFISSDKNSFVFADQ